MKFNKNILFMILVVFLLSLNFAVAKDLNETNVNLESLEIDYDNSISISNPNFQDNDNLNQVSSVQSTESSNQSTEIISKENSNDNNLLNDIDYNHVYVSPDGDDDGSTINTPGNFIDIIGQVEDNTIIHMLNGTYDITGTSSIDIEDINNVMIIADNPDKVIINSTIYGNKNRGTDIFYLYNCNFKFENITFTSTLVENQGDYNYIWSYFCLEEGNYIFDNCKFINTYSSLGVIYLEEDTSDTKVKINNCSFINNNIITDDYTFPGLFCVNSGDLSLENIICDKSYNIYYPIEDSGVFSSHATLTFLNGEESVTVGENSNFLINASLVDDYSNIIILPNIKCTIFGQERTLSYSDGVYQTTVTTPDILDTYYIEGVDDFIDTYLSDCNIIKPDIVVKHSHNVTLNTSDIDYGENATVNITVSSMESGNISYTLKLGSTIIKEDVIEFSNNFSSIVLDNLDAGTYTFNANVLGNEEYGLTSVSKTLIVNKAIAPINITFSPVITVDENITITVNVPEDVTGSFEYIRIAGSTSNRVAYTDNINNLNNCTFNLTFKLSADNYQIYWNFESSNPNYSNNKQEVNGWGSSAINLNRFKVVRVDSNLTVKAEDVDWGNNVTVSITTDSRFTGNVTVKLGSDEKIAEIKDGSGSVSFANLKADTYNVTAKFNETDLFAPSQKDINVTVNKVNATLTLGDDIVFDWNKTGSTTVSYSGATNVEAVIVETGTSIPIQGNTITVSNLKADTYTLRVTATPDENHTQTTKTISIKVNKVNSTLTLGDDITFDYGESGSTTVSYEGATDVVAEVVNNTATIKIENGNITVSGLDAGNYTLKVTTVPDDDHANVTKTVNITVKKVDCDINIMNPVIYVYGNIGQCSVFSEGVIDFTASILNHTEAIINIDSNGIVNVSGLNVGKYVLEVTANPDKNHNSITRQTNVTVSEAESQITIPNIVFTYGESGSVNATLVGATGITNASVLNHTEAVVKIVNNTITVSGLNAGSYVLQATTIPDANHNPVTATANITVNGVEVPADKAISTNVPANTKSPTFSIKLDKDATGTFTVNIDNGKIVKTAELKDGAASITVADLTAGDHTISVSYSGDGKYAPITQNTTMKVKTETKLAAAKVTANYASAKKLVVTLKDKNGKAIAGKKVTVKVGTISKTLTTNKNGQVSVDVSTLAPKSYTAKFTFAGDKAYTASSGSASVKVNKGVTKITAAKKTFKVKAKNKKYTITLKSGKKLISKVKVTIKVGKKTYTAKTNKNGKATFNLKKLTKKGKYTAVIKFKENKNYKATSKKVKIILK